MRKSPFDPSGNYCSGLTGYYQIFLSIYLNLAAKRDNVTSSLLQYNIILKDDGLQWRLAISFNVRLAAEREPQIALTLE